VNRSYFGDNLGWLRNHDEFPNESVDLLYLDPPFNSKPSANAAEIKSGLSSRSPSWLSSR
jgi:16S rRNA G966 N2-methylase RsmD